MRKIILTGAVLAMLTSAAPMVHAQIPTDVQEALDKKVDKDAGNIVKSKWQTMLGDGKNEAGNTGLVTGGTLNKALDGKVNQAKTDLEGKITENKKLIQGDDGNGGLKKELADIKNIVGEDDKKGLQNKVKTLETNFEARRQVLTTLDTISKDNKKLLVGDNGNGGLKKDVEDLKRVVGENDTEGLQKSVKENTNKITEVDRKASKALTDVAELKAKGNDMAKDIAELGGRIDVTGAMSAALAGLKPLQYDPMAPTQVMGSVSTYEGQQAYALGLAHFTSEDLMVHGGVSFTNSHKYMANVGVTYKFGHSAEKSMIPMRYQAGPISSIYVTQKENEMMREKMAQQEERIAQLEEMIMNMKK